MTNARYRTPRSSLAAFLVALATMAALPSCSRPEPVLIGFAASLTGKDYMLGVDGRNALELFARERNAGGGIAGRRIELAIRDFASDDANVVEMDRQLVEDEGAGLVLGHFTSSSAELALPYFDAAGIPLVSPAATSTGLGGRDDAFFRTIMSSGRDPFLLAEHMASAGVDAVMVIATAQNAPYVSTYVDVIAGAMPVAGDFRYVDVHGLDYAAMAAALEREPAGTDAAVLVVASAIDTGTIAQELRKRGIDEPLYVSGWAGNDDLVTYGGKAVEGAVFVHQIDFGSPGVVDFADRYERLFGTRPGFGAVETWDAMLFVEAALRTAAADGTSLLEAMRSIRSFEGASGTILMDAYGDARRALYFKQVRGGSIVVTGKAE